MTKTNSGVRLADKIAGVEIQPMNSEAIGAEETFEQTRAKLNMEWWHTAAQDIFGTRSWELVKRCFKVRNRLHGVEKTDGARLTDELCRYRRRTPSLRLAFAALVRDLRRRQR